jgi:hypothetical protein
LLLESRAVRIGDFRQMGSIESLEGVESASHGLVDVVDETVPLNPQKASGSGHSVVSSGALSREF